MRGIFIFLVSFQLTHSFSGEAQLLQPKPGGEYVVPESRVNPFSSPSYKNYCALRNEKYSTALHKTVYYAMWPLGIFANGNALYKEVYNPDKLLLYFGYYSPPSLIIPHDVIAREERPKQSHSEPDCFAPLAMTGGVNSNIF